MKKVLIANRGEIAVRIIRTLREMNIRSVAVYSVADKDSLHVSLADEACCIGPAKSSESYLNIESILAAAEISGADAVHPGYGFLSETPGFARRCEEEGIIFIGPTSEMMQKMGDKAEARATMRAAGVPVIPGSDGPVETLDEVRAVIEDVGYPVVIKAVSGGGGKGMRFVHDESSLEKSYKEAKKEAKNAFDDDRIYVERYIPKARHIEVQVVGDGNGNAVHLYERDCSIQRNNQKLIEEAPAQILTDESRKSITETTRDAIAKLKYGGAGTVEYLYVEEEDEFHFIEMNTRIQVEHTVTEQITGVDIVRMQVEVALFNELNISQEEIEIDGFAIEVRINAEDSGNNFMPSPGPINMLHFALGRNVRVDTAVYPGYKIPPNYDSMIAKLIVSGRDRSEVINKMTHVLDETVIGPLKTNLDFQYYLMQHPNYNENIVDIKFLTRNEIIEE
ncbi:acetyl-CoA carboxylase biotin carboxylase subunit [Lacicoccus alkaliphilus]|uniref:biotin carboxylase n=1 Tax=Lacicoccus alkaliphilus DSM 16010 TaxID=1123231 RepID=A0A1M7E008_9BACL|nr:acetyl-CoA carboxylase biotin carboxylase subunit [Salinicoccus alkaliphilus]SHL85091.1 acetyl-CoA carboxylase, biotin carboxylase subunit [Salinicoccus alkaliphilus DSM 16010]